MNPPSKIYFKDGCIAELVPKKIKQVEGEEFFYYKYTVSNVKDDKEFPMLMSDIKRLEAHKLLTIQQ
jgi:hypothetical protein